MNKAEKENHDLKPWNASGFLVRLCLTSILFIGAFYAIGPFYVRLYLPLFERQMEFFHPEYDIIQSDITIESGIKYFEFIIKVNKPLAIHREGENKSGNIFRLKGQASSLCVGPVIVFALIFSWPSISLRRRFQSLLLSIPLIVFIECADYPMIFMGHIESVHSVNMAANTIRGIWSHILNNGGRQFLALIIFLIVIAPYYLKLAEVDGKEPTGAIAKTSRNAPCGCGSGKKYKNCCFKKIVKK